MKKKINLLVVVGLAIVIAALVSLKKQRQAFDEGSYSTVDTNHMKMVNPDMTDQVARKLYLQEITVDEKGATVVMDAALLNKEIRSDVYLQEKVKNGVILLTKDSDLKQLRPPDQAPITELNEQSQFAFLLAFVEDEIGRAKVLEIIYITKVENNTLHLASYGGLYYVKDGSFAWANVPPSLYRIHGHFKRAE